MTVNNIDLQLFFNPLDPELPGVIGGETGVVLLIPGVYPYKHWGWSWISGVYIDFGRMFNCSCIFRLL